MHTHTISILIIISYVFIVVLAQVPKPRAANRAPPRRATWNAPFIMHIPEHNRGNWTRGLETHKVGTEIDYVAPLEPPPDSPQEERLEDIKEPFPKPPRGGWGILPGHKRGQKPKRITDINKWEYGQHPPRHLLTKVHKIAWHGLRTKERPPKYPLFDARCWDNHLLNHIPGRPPYKDFRNATLRRRRKPYFCLEPKRDSLIAGREGGFSDRRKKGKQKPVIMATGRPMHHPQDYENIR
jgi:hypothetical protein